MARRLHTNVEIDNFISRVIAEAAHHAGNVQSVIQPLSDEVRLRINLARDKVEVYERNGNLARTCWVTIQGKRYVFSYNYQSQCIDLRDHSLQGAVRYQFDNSTLLSDIQREAASL